MVDHIHFQYNGILFGLLLLSVGFVLSENYLWSAFCFAVLLNMKHIFIYVAPVYIVYLFKFYCLRKDNFIFNLVKLATVVGAVTGASFGPFYEHIPQVLLRLFPFKRGLSHAYWAPNFWSLYNFVDKVVSVVLKKKSHAAAMTGGLVQTYDHDNLPSITPVMTFAITGVAMLPCLLKLLFLKYDKARTGSHFIRALTICACTSFMFGWHVHEKAILMVLIPLTVLAVLDKTDAKAAFFLGIVGHYSLFPLLFTVELTLVKTYLFLAYTSLALYGLRSLHQDLSLNLLVKLYVFGLGCVFVYENVVHKVLNLDERFPFLPLMLTSVYCGFGVFMFWLVYYVRFLFMGSHAVEVKGGKLKKN
jgi:alpha-1,3-glucosyltransferase